MVAARSTLQDGPEPQSPLAARWQRLKILLPLFSRFSFREPPFLRLAGSIAVEYVYKAIVIMAVCVALKNQDLPLDEPRLGAACKTLFHAIPEIWRRNWLSVAHYSAAKRRSVPFSGKGDRVVVPAIPSKELPLICMKPGRAQEGHNVAPFFDHRA
jgi:hypothetical protein